jgi:hypothetical protein
MSLNQGGMKMKRIFSIMVVLQLLFSLIYITSIIPMNASAPQLLPTVTIALTETSKTAYVGPGESGEVIFNGVVQVTQNPLTRVVVSLTAEDTWGSAVVSPSTLTFSSGGSQPFTVDVRVPSGVDPGTVGTVTVYGRWRMYPGSLGGSAEPQQGVTGRIDIAQYHQLTISSPNSYIKASLEERVEFELSIRNEGNFNESVICNIMNNEGLSSNGISVSMSSSEVYIPINEIRTSYVYANTFSGTVGGNHIIQVKITTNDDPYGDDQMWMHEFTLELPENSNTPPGDPDPEPPEPDPEPEPEPQPPDDEEPDDNDISILYTEDTGDEDTLFSSREFIFFMMLLFLIGIVTILVIGWAKERRFRKPKKRSKRLRY